MAARTLYANVDLEVSQKQMLRPHVAKQLRQFTARNGNNQRKGMAYGQGAKYIPKSANMAVREVIESVPYAQLQSFG